MNSILDSGIVYIDDDKGSRSVGSILLKKVLGFKRVAVFSVFNLDEIDNLPFKPEIFLLDVHMEPDGFFTAEALKKAGYEGSAFVALTASVTTFDTVRILQVFDGIIGKPLIEENFLEELENIVTLKAGK